MLNGVKVNACRSNTAESTGYQAQLVLSLACLVVVSAPRFGTNGQASQGERFYRMPMYAIVLVGDHHAFHCRRYMNSSATFAQTS